MTPKERAQQLVAQTRLWALADALQITETIEQAIIAACAAAEAEAQREKQRADVLEDANQGWKRREDLIAADNRRLREALQQIADCAVGNPQKLARAALAPAEAPGEVRLQKVVTYSEKEN